MFETAADKMFVEIAVDWNSVETVVDSLWFVGIAVEHRRSELQCCNSFNDLSITHSLDGMTDLFGAA